jgi:hypothetical protein
MTFILLAALALVASAVALFVECVRIERVAETERCRRRDGGRWWS